MRRLEEETGLSRGAIFHHFRDKDSLFLAVAEDDAAAMVATVARNGLVQVMRDLLDQAASPDTTGWLGSQLEVSRRLRTDPEFAKRWADRSAAIAEATRDRLARQRDAGVLRDDVDLDVLAQFLELAYDGLVLHLAMGRPAGDLGRGARPGRGSGPRGPACAVVHKPLAPGGLSHRYLNRRPRVLRGVARRLHNERSGAE